MSSTSHNILTQILSAPPPTNNTLPYTSPTTSQTITPSHGILIIRRLAAGFDRMGIPKQTPVLVLSPLTIYTPLIYLATVGSGRIYISLDPFLSKEQLAEKIKELKPELILADPVSSLEKVMEVVERTELRNRIFSFDSAEGDWSDPKNGILDWKILMARAVDGRGWVPEAFDERRAREMVAVINEDGSRRSHLDSLQIARTRPDVSPWLAVLPWYQQEQASKNRNGTKL